MQIYAPLNAYFIPQLQKIEVATLFQLPQFQIIGLPSPEVAEAKERIRSAFESMGFEFPKRKVIINLSPASVRKQGTGLDLAMALSILSLRLNFSTQIQISAWGELGLDGKVKSIGQLTRAIYVSWKSKIQYLFLPQSDFQAVFQAIQLITHSNQNLGQPPVIILVKSLSEAWEIAQNLPLKKATQFFVSKSFDFNQIKVEFLSLSQFPDQAEISKYSAPSSNESQASLLPLSSALERVMGVAASGSHHFLLLGPHGVGKSHAVEWFLSAQSSFSGHDQFEWHLISELRENDCHSKVNHCPVRRVSSHVKPGALLGSYTPLAFRPGEFALAHGGVLVADEFPEWARDSRELFREPLELGKITLSRARGAIELPSRFILAANGNLCPCGGWPSDLPLPDTKMNEKEHSNLPRCICTTAVRRNYISRLSGPILDRIDLVVVMTSSSQEPNHDRNHSILEQCLKFKTKVNRTSRFLLNKYKKLPGAMKPNEIEFILSQHAQLNDQLSELSIHSLRSRHKIARVALTLAAWDQMDEPQKSHFLEASFYRLEKLGFN